MKWQKNREGFSMFIAIVIIVLMATVAMLVTNMTGKLVKETTAQYQREQAVLLANSYTEYAVLAVTGNDRSTACLSTINGTWNGYSARIQIAYIGTVAEIGPLGNSIKCANTRKLGTVPTGSQTPLTIIVDAYIDYSDLDNPTGTTLTYHRRTIQKI